MIASQRSLRALDWLNVFLADIRYGIGPFLAIYLLTQLKWNPLEIGFAMSIPGITAIVFQSPSGALVDYTRHKRLLVVVACIFIGLCNLGMILAKDKSTIILIQFIMGITITIYTPAITAITLGLVGNEKFPRRMGRNHTFNHAGNVVITSLAGALGYFFGFTWVFLVMITMCILSSVAILFIREKEIDHSLAREAVKIAGKEKIAAFRQVLLDRNILLYTFAVVLFYFANGAMLPLLSQLLARGNEQMATLYTGGGIIIAEITMVPVAALTGYAASKGNRKIIFIIAFVVLVVRGFLYTLSDNPNILLSIQILDGVAAGIAGVITIVMIADLTKGTGRFNFMQGAIVTAIEIGEALSHFSAGHIVKHYSYDVGFIFLSVVAIGGLLFFWTFVPETKGIRER